MLLQRLFLHTTTDKNTDPDLINPNIIIAQDTELQQILGYQLYTYIMDLVSTGNIVTLLKAGISYY